MPNNKIIAVLVLLASAIFCIFKFVSEKRSEKKKEQVKEEKGPAKIIPLSPEFNDDEVYTAEDEFYALDDIDLLFLRGIRNEERIIDRVSFDFLKNNDCHYVISNDDTDKIRNELDPDGESDIVTALRNYFDGCEDCEKALVDLLGKLEISYEYLGSDDSKFN